MIKKLFFFFIIFCIFNCLTPSAIATMEGIKQTLVFDKGEIKKVEHLISKYGKSNIITSIQFLNSGDCTVQVDNELRKSFGRPQEVFVTSYSILFDFNELELTIEKAEELIQHTIERGKKTVTRQLEREREAREIAEQEKRDYEDFLSGKGKYEKKRIKQPANNSQWKLGVMIITFCLLLFALGRWISRSVDHTLKENNEELWNDGLNINADNKADMESERQMGKPLLEMKTSTEREQQDTSTKQKKMVIKITYTGLIILFGTLLFGLVRDLVGKGQFLIAGLLVYLLFLTWGKDPVVKNEEKEHKNIYLDKG